MPMLTLPSKPSELIRLALSDLRKVEAQPEQYRVDMATFHVVFGEVCSICFAGAVMSQTIKVPPMLDVGPNDFPRHLRNPLMALDSFRSGFVETGLEHMELCRPKGLEMHFQVAPYNVFPERFHQDMEKLAQRLEEFGL